VNNLCEWIKPREIEEIEPVVSKYYIFCEGEQTEPNYFEGFKKYIELNAIYKNIVQITIEGLGKETERILNYAIDYVNNKKISDAKIWCVYDKDSFPAEHFNNVSERIRTMNKSPNNNIKYYGAWSNQCIEYWFILHFNYYDADNDRSYYIENLNKNFKIKELGVYHKSKDKEIFDKLSLKGNPKLAIKHAKRRIKECKGQSDTNSSPATKVYELVEELANYLPADMKQFYL